MPMKEMKELEDSRVFLDAMNAMRFLAAYAAEGSAYGNGWSDSFRSKEIDGAFQKLKGSSPYGSEEFWRKVFALPRFAKRLLGFIPFEAEDQEMCIPLWIWQLLPDDMQFQEGKKKDLDNDSRMGCVWWKA